jgi:septin family protein
VANPLQLPPFRLIHAAYVTAGDLETGKRKLSALFGVTQFRDYSSLHINSEGGGVTIDFSIANASGTHLEVIKPLSGRTDIYRDALPADPTTIGFHHYASRVDNQAEWELIVKAIDEHGIKTFNRGANADLKHVYLDTRAHVGHMLEYIWLTNPHSALADEVLRPFGH